MERKGPRPTRKEPTFQQPIPTQSVFNDPDFNPNQIATDPLKRIFAINDAATIFFTEQIAHGVPIADAKRLAEKTRDCGRGRKAIISTLKHAKIIFNPGINNP